MHKVIVDTSSLIAFAQMQQHYDSPSSVTSEYRYDGFDNFIEALVLYENVWLDGPSYYGNIYKYPKLDSVSKYYQILKITEEEEREAYSSISELYKNIQANPGSANLFGGHTERWMLDEVGAGSTYPSSSWADVEAVLPEDLRGIAKELRERFKESLPHSGAACLAIIRTLYYQSLQRTYGANLLLHPWKGYFYESYEFRGFSSSIIHMFDETVRERFHERKSKWLGGKEVGIKFPMIAKYIFNRSKSWDDVLKFTVDLRETKEAKEFRVGIADLTKAIDNNDNVLLDEILSSLDKAQESWAKQLGHRLHPDKKITISVPIINLGVETDFMLPDRQLRKRPADKILIFIHMLLRHS